MPEAPWLAGNQALRQGSFPSYGSHLRAGVYKRLLQDCPFQARLPEKENNDARYWRKGNAPPVSASASPLSGIDSDGAAQLWLVTTVCAAIVAAWVAAGSVGLLAHSLRHAIGLVLIGVIAIASLRRGLRIFAALALLGAASIAALMNASRLPVVNVFAPAVIVSVAALFHPDACRKLLTRVALAISVFALYRLFITCVPSAWLAADAMGRLLGRMGGAVTGQPLWVGATFGGLDFLVLMAALLGSSISLRSPPRYRVILYTFSAVAVAQLLYLIALAYAPKFLTTLPPPKTPDPAIPFQQDLRTWADVLRDCVPGNVPMLAAVLHCMIVICYVRWGWEDSERRGPATPAARPLGRNILSWGAAVGLAIILPEILVLGWCKSDLLGKKIVLYERGLNNWFQPEHGQYGRLNIGMYGLLPTYLRSLGATVLLSPDLSEEDMKGADVVVLVYPNQPWDDGQVARGQVQRIDDFVQNGGSLLLFSDHTTHEDDGRNRANDVLAPHEFATARISSLDEFLSNCARHRGQIEAGQAVTGETPPPIDFVSDKLRSMMDDKPRRFAYDADSQHRAEAERERLRPMTLMSDTQLRIRFDAAEFAVGGWLQSYEPLAHPATTGMRDDRNQFGVVIGASVECHWPARPLLVGRWGWIDEGDPGTGPAMLGNHVYDPGEKLGDMILAAEQSYGRGRIVAFGDTSTFNNGINIGAHQFTCRLFSYLANGGVNPQSPWRQFVGLLLMGTLLVLLLRKPDAIKTGLTAITLAASLAACTAWTWAATDVPPDGRRILPQPVRMHPDPITSRTVGDRQEWTPRQDGDRDNYLAYMDLSHLPESSEESWRPDGCMGLAMSFMRDGYLTLQMHEFSEKRLSKAAIYVSVAPSRTFSKSEREVLDRYVRAGGILICTAGWDKCTAVRDLLNDFGLYVGIAPPPADGSEPPAPEPLGFFKSPYYDGGGYQAFVRFHAAWPVGPDPASTPLEGLRVLAYGNLHGKDLPVILMRRVGLGAVVLVGDTSFAMNKNLETEEGDAFDGAHENSDFWRWLIPQLTGRAAWYPSPQPPATAPADAPAAETAATQPAVIPLVGPLGPPIPSTEPTTLPATMPALVPSTDPATLPSNPGATEPVGAPASQPIAPPVVGGATP